jgi:hypothetical protein
MMVGGQRPIKIALSTLFSTRKWYSLMKITMMVIASISSSDVLNFFIGYKGNELF